MTAKVAMITGGGYGGIGASTAERLAEQGFSIGFTDLRHSAAENVVKKLPGDKHLALALDVTLEADVTASFATIERALGPVTALICCAGVMITPVAGPPEIVDTSVDDWDRTFAVNARGAYLCVREYLRKRKQAPVQHGRIVLISSVAAQLGGYRGSPDYIASKAAVSGLTKIAARQSAALGITVNCIAPGFIETPMFREAVPPGTETELLQRVPLGRLGTPNEIAAAIAFLVSIDAGYITGSTIDVNGGYRMQ